MWRGEMGGMGGMRESEEGPIAVWLVEGGKMKDGVRERKIARATATKEIIRIHLSYGVGPTIYSIIGSQNISVADETGMGYYIRGMNESQGEGERA